MEDKRGLRVQVHAPIPSAPLSIYRNSGDICSISVQWHFVAEVVKLSEIGLCHHCTNTLFWKFGTEIDGSNCIVASATNYAFYFLYCIEWDFWWKIRKVAWGEWDFSFVVSESWRRPYFMDELPKYLDT